jgi:hypothetical protein
MIVLSSAVERSENAPTEVARRKSSPESTPDSVRSARTFCSQAFYALSLEIAAQDIECDLRRDLPKAKNTAPEFPNTAAGGTRSN